ncbi:MAG: ParB/RepB/Spo0J family partition protein [Candidatus Taylorbacteria bacterium]|nr:ParB/RepB/Spo0J family partition protein [Candidatus Taylorbacteria bacterium]
MKSPAEALGKSIKPTNFGQPKFVAKNWYITDITVISHDESVYNGTTKLVKVDENNRERFITWNASRLDDKSWRFDNNHPGYSLETPFSMEKEIDALIRSIMSSWLNEKYEPAGTTEKSSENVTRDRGPQPQKPGVELPRSKFLLIPVNRIRPNKDQPRKAFRRGELNEIKKSLSQDGQNTPIEVLEVQGDPNADWELVKGERRWRAARELGLEKLEAIVRTRDQIPDKKKQHRWCFIGDFHHARYNKIEIALALLQEYSEGATMAELGHICARSTTWVSTHLTLTNLHPTLLRKLDPKLPRREQLSASIAWRLAKVPANEQMDIYRKIAQVESSRLQLIETKRLIAEKMPDRPSAHGRPRKPTDNVKSMLVAVPRMVADAITVDNYSNATIDSLLANRPAEVERVLEYISTVIQRLRSFGDKIKKARRR